MTQDAEPRRTARDLAAFLIAALLTCPVAGCGRAPGTSTGRVVEREESVGGVLVELRSELHPARGTLGDRIVWRLAARVRGSAEPESLILGPVLAALDVDASKPPTVRRESGQAIWSRSYVVRGFDLGALPLPAASLALRVGARRDTLDLPRDTLFVDSLTQSVTGTLRPDRGPIDPELRPVDYAVALGGALLLLALLALATSLLLRARRRSREPAAAGVPEPPETILVRALDALREEFNALPRDVLYERLSLALRSYAQATTGAPTLDLTTSEVDRELGGRPRVISEGRRALIAALNRADLAKFARYEDEASEAMAILREAKGIAGKLVRPPPGPEPASGRQPPTGPEPGTRD